MADIYHSLDATSKGFVVANLFMAAPACCTLIYFTTALISGSNYTWFTIVVMTNSGITALLSAITTTSIIIVGSGSCSFMGQVMAGISLLGQVGIIFAPLILRFSGDDVPLSEFVYSVVVIVVLLLFACGAALISAIENCSNWYPIAEMNERVRAYRESKGETDASTLTQLQLQETV